MKANIALYKAIAKSMLGRYLVYLMNLISLMILSRIFTPETYGIIAAVVVFFVFFQLLSEAGLGPAIINLHELKEKDRDGIFSFTFLMGFILSILFYLVSHLGADFYGVEQTKKVTPFIALSVLMFSITSLPNALLLREQCYYKIASSAALAEFFSTLIAVVLSFVIEPLYALSSKYLALSTLNFIFKFYYCNRINAGRPKFGSDLMAVKPLMTFSVYQFLFNVVNYFSRNLDNILIGKYIGVTTLGIYDKAYQIMKYPLMLLTFAMTPAIQPFLRQYSGDRAKVEEIHVSLTFKLSILGTLCGVIIFFFAKEIIHLMLGAQWYSVIPIIKILAITIPVQVVTSTSGSFFQSLNKPQYLFYSGLLSALFMISAIIVGVIEKNVILIVWLLLCAMVINFFQVYLLLYLKVFKKKPIKFFIKMVPMILSIVLLTLYELHRTGIII